MLTVTFSEFIDQFQIKLVNTLLNSYNLINISNLHEIMRVQYFITLIYGFWKFAVVTKRKHNKLIKEYIEVRLNIILYFLVFDSPYVIMKYS